MDNMDPALFMEVMKLQAQQYEIFGEAIKLEIHEMIAETRVRGTAAADQLKASYDAWLNPQDRLAQVEEDISLAETEIRARENIGDSSEDIGDRVMAGAALSEWRRQLKLSRQEKAKIEQQLIPLHAEYQRHLDKLTGIANEVGGLELNLKIPFIGAGKQTHAYRIWQEFGGQVPELLHGSGPNYEAGRRFLEELCVRAEVYVAKADEKQITRELMDAYRKKLGTPDHSVHSSPIEPGSEINYDTAIDRNFKPVLPVLPVRDYMNANLPNADILRP